MPWGIISAQRKTQEIRGAAPAPPSAPGTPSEAGTQTTPQQQQPP